MILFLRKYKYFQSLVIILILSINSHATTPPSSLPCDLLWSHPFDTTGIAANYNIEDVDGVIHNARRDLDNYFGAFRRICIFLDSMQEHNEEDESYGGLHEGEGNREWEIIETDNTQESIRDWCLYANIFDEPETYRENVEAAWEYCHNFPAWEESDPGEMYGLHNSGWGLMAEMAYREAYCDDEREYGLRCAEHIVEHTPQIEIDMEDHLMPLVAGWAAGTLYEYGNYENNDDYREAAIRIAVEVKEWIDEDVNRLNNNEIWALCGGTAMWGVLTTLGQIDSAETADWAVECLDRMDIFAGHGNWNNSANIWYAHAWVAAWRLTDDDEYLANVITIVDSLLAQDGDRDGGIPATGGDGDDRDQSWVTAYTGWMGLSNLFEVLPDVNVEVVSLVEPSLERSWPVGEPLSFSFIIANDGNIERIETPFTFRGEWNADSIVTLNGWDDHILTLLPDWTPEDDGEFEFTAYTDHIEDADRSNDSLTFTLNILPVGMMRTSTFNSNGEAITCRFDYYNLDLDLNDVFLSYTSDGLAENPLMIGNYRIEVIPDFPYPHRTIDEYEKTEEQQLLTLTFHHPPVLLVDRDTDTTHVVYYEKALTNNDRTYYNWSSNLYGSFEERSEGFHTLIYFTGNRADETILPEDRDEIEAHLERGGSLFITGQDISYDLAEDPFLEDVLHCRSLSNSMGRGVVDGLEGDPLMDGMWLLLFGNQGANNQQSIDGIAPLDEAVACAEYRDKPDTAAVIRWETQSGGKAVFFAFGLEGISGAGNTTDINEMMAAILDWFDTPHKAPQVSDIILLPTAFSATAFPNPTNGGVRIRFNSSFQQSIEIVIFNLNGRKVRRLNGTMGSSTFWDCFDETGKAVPSGTYFFGCFRDGAMFGSGVGIITLIR